MDPTGRAAFTMMGASNAVGSALRTSAGLVPEPVCLQKLKPCVVMLRQRARDLERDIERRLDAYEVGKLLTTIQGASPLTAACIIAETGEPARFRSAAALASYVGVVPRLTSQGNVSSPGE